MKKVGILGGTFDPVHKGHLAMAKLAVKELSLNEVWFMPALKTPLKDRELTSFEMRCAMIKRAIAPYRKMKLCTLEAELPLPSYTIQTVDVLKKRYPSVQFYWIIGQDQADQFDRWKESERLKKEVQIVVLHREGTAFKELAGALTIRDFNVPISSTAVRSGNWQWVPEAVRLYMVEKGLYLDSLLKAKMSDYRYNHSVSMTKLAVLLAKKHGVDPHSAYLAGMLHDIAKEMDLKQAEEVMRIIHPAELGLSHKIWHQWLGEDYVRTHLKITDAKILSAISHHVRGDGKGKLARIIYIADKIDPFRGYDIQRQLEASLRSLDEGMRIVALEQSQYLKQEGVHESASFTHR